ncbi:MAG: cytochrome C oxidase subunit IV family protein [Candidatus Binatia bacterium]
MSVEKPSVGYVTIWVWLVALLAMGVAVLAMPLSKAVAVVLIFTVASVKAALVVRHYMHVRAQPLMMYVILCVPLVLAIALILVLLPDIGLR